MEPEITRLYRLRFNKELKTRNKIWKILCRDFFQKYVKPTDTLCDIGAGYCEFINNINAKNKIAIDINKERGDDKSISAIYANMAGIMSESGDQEKALKNYYLALDIRKRTGDKQGIIEINLNVGQLYLNSKKYGLARTYFEVALQMALEMKAREDLKLVYSQLTVLEKAEGNFKAAVFNYKLFIAYSDSLTNQENTKKIVRSQMQYDFDKKEDAAKAEQDKKDAIALTDKKRQMLLLWFAMGGLLAVLFFALYVYRNYREKKIANVEITKQKNIIEEKQKDILDSIYYAKRIQRSLLPTEKYIHKNLTKLIH